jgi:type VI secretion system protein ImpC
MDDNSWTPDFGELGAAPPAWAPKRPVRIAVLGDFSAGGAGGRLEIGSDLAARKAMPVEFDNLEDTLARLEPTLTLPVGHEGEGVTLEFGELDAFHPDTLYRELPLFKALADLRKKLNNTATFAKAAAEVQSWAGGGKKRASRARPKRSKGGAPAADAKLSDFARLVGGGAATAELRVGGSVDALLRQVVGPFVEKAPDPKRDALVATVDKALSDVMRSVLHQSEFQNLESLWRGLDMLLRRIETGPSLQVHLIDISADEFAADLSSVSDVSEAGLHSLLVDKPSQEKNGGYSLICGLFHFEATPPHAELLGRMAKIAAAAGAPFVTAIASDAFMDKKRAPHPLVVQAMSALRGLPEAGALALLSPRFMLRHPYGKRSDPISSFAFEEFTAADGLRGMLWGHPALIAAAILAAPTGKTLSIGDIPFHYFTDADGDQIALPCTERLIPTDIAARLRGFGITALMAHKGQPELRLAGLDAVDGSALGLQVVRTQSARVSVATSAQAAGKPSAKARPTAPADEEEAGAEADAGIDLDASADDGSGGGDDLDALLASLGDDDGSADASADADADAGSDGGEEMDPELAELLKSLE